MNLKSIVFSVILMVMGSAQCMDAPGTKKPWYVAFKESAQELFKREEKPLNLAEIKSHISAKNSNSYLSLLPSQVLNITRLQLASVQCPEQTGQNIFIAGALLDFPEGTLDYLETYAKSIDSIAQKTAPAQFILAALKNKNKDANQVIVKLLKIPSLAPFLISYRTDETSLIKEATLAHNVDVIKLLIRAGADINQTDNNGRTPLILACQRGLLEIATELITAKADISKTDVRNRTALFYAQKGNHRHQTKGDLLSDVSGGGNNFAPVVALLKNAADQQAK